MPALPRYRSSCLIQYSDESTLRDARAAYFANSGFAPDGGYTDRWVVLKAGGIPVFAFPNTAARVRAVRFHDLHHVLTAYDTTWAGEAEIGAWELASGCGRHYPAWLLNFVAVAIGIVLWPRRVIEAFRRGLRSQNLYREELTEQLLNQTVGQVRERLKLT